MYRTVFRHKKFKDSNHIDTGGGRASPNTEEYIYTPNEDLGLHVYVNVNVYNDAACTEIWTSISIH